VTVTSFSFVQKHIHFIVETSKQKALFWGVVFVAFCPLFVVDLTLKMPCSFSCQNKILSCGLKEARAFDVS